jgi:hypothetical protein
MLINVLSSNNRTQLPQGYGGSKSLRAAGTRLASQSVTRLGQFDYLNPYVGLRSDALAESGR